MSDVARILSSHALRYRAGADATVDRPAHVRAASGVCWVQTRAGPRLAACQDDALFVALIDPTTFAVDAIALPAPDGVRQFDTGRGNKMAKKDFESICPVPDALGCVWLFGSGSAPVREVRATVNLDDATTQLSSTSGLCAALRAHPLLADAELNLEGACVLDDEVVLLQRGNGLGAVNAVARVPLADVTGRPQVRVHQVDLPRVDEVPLTFTDACLHNGALFFLAAAEASPNAIDDGDVVGSAVGVLSLDRDAPRVTALWHLTEPDGAPSLRKPEGLCIAPDGRVFIVTDADDPHRPSDLLLVALPVRTPAQSAR